MRGPQPQPASPLFQALLPMYGRPWQFPPPAVETNPAQPVDPLQVLMGIMGEQAGGEVAAAGSGRKKKGGGGGSPVGRTFQDRSY